MPYQNRVDPFGQFHAVDARGAWMGNRGILHNDAGQILVQWRLKRWITCSLIFKGRHRQVFTPHNFSELFFLDEATAFSAGHRPCAECRRPRYNEFCRAWSMANPNISEGSLLRAEEIDRQLHSERTLPGRAKRSYDSKIRDLPSGTFIERQGVAHLIWNGKLHPWSFGGYGPPLLNAAHNEVVRVLTPSSIVATFRSGFVPQVHDSVRH
jgi:hypothetical protein